MRLLVENEAQPELGSLDSSHGDSDESLLRRFVKSRCDLAFATLVERHGLTVMGVCRRVLTDAQDAEDAFQATFMVLARKASSLRTASSLSAWLYKTAFRIAVRARANRLRRREQSLESEVMLEDHQALQQIAAEHERSILDEELNRLPEKLRLPLYLCCVEGKTRDDAAAQLGWSVGSLKGRLERGRQLLRRRLTLRGVSLSAVLVLWMRTQATAQATLTPSLVASTVQASLQFASGGPALGYVSLNALNLAKGSFPIMTFGVVKMVACTIALIGLLSAANARFILPASAAGDDNALLVVASTLADDHELTFVALADDGQDKPRDGDRPRDGQARENAERREGDRPRGGDRPRDSDRPRDGQARDGVERRDGDRPRGGDAPRRDGARRPDFKPQTEREAALYRMIQQLQREVAEIKRQLQSRDGDRPRGTRERPDVTNNNRRDEGQSARERTVRSAQLPPSWQRTKEGKVFKAYDRDGDGKVTLREWYAMQEGLDDGDSARGRREAARFAQADPNSDGHLTVAEFLHWYTKGRHQNTREGDGNESSNREQDKPRDREPRRETRDTGRSSSSPGDREG